MSTYPNPRKPRPISYYFLLLSAGAIAELVIGIVVSTVLIQPSIAATERISPVWQDQGKTELSSQVNLLTAGRLAYQAGRYQEAKMLWQKAYRQFVAAENIIAQAQSLNYLALTCHKLGEWQLAEQYLTQSLQLLPRHDSDVNGLKITAQTLNTQGRLELAKGKTEAALASWQQAAVIYQQIGDEEGLLGVTINQIQAWQSLGLYRRAQKKLKQIAPKFATQSNLSLKIIGLRSLGIALRVTGDLEAAYKTLHQSVVLAQKLNLPEEVSASLFSLGNTAVSLKNYESAIDFYRQAAALTTRPLLKIEAQLNQLNLFVLTAQWQQAEDLRNQIQADLANLSVNPSRKVVYARVNLAKRSIELNDRTKNPKYFNQTKDLLQVAIQQAQELEDLQAESYALGVLGHLYEKNQQPAEGSKYTKRAVYLAQQISNDDLTYQWQWQLGRLYRTLDNHQGAIASYSEAVNALESLRGDLVVTNRDAQFSFRNNIEPVYRDLVDLLLTVRNGRPVSQSYLSQARQTIEQLQLAELNDFFREACIDATPTNIDRVDLEAAVIYPIILSDRLEVVVSLPDRSLRHYSHVIAQTELESIIERLRQTLQVRSRRQFYAPAQKLYRWLITPVLKDLADNKIKTIVFVPDGTFRNIPLAALHNGKQYLIEQYNVALTPGLQLLAPVPLEEVKLTTLAAGITQRRRGFSALQYVAQELTNIQNQTDSKVLRDDRFTQKMLRENVATDQYRVVHIATHGQFSSNLEDTFLLAWDSNIGIKELENILKSVDPKQKKAIELLVLSACETASGDKKATLGLAGIAVRAGARTTLATLWTVYDESTAMTMSDFYQQITQPQRLNKAYALRQAQLSLLHSRDFKHPYYWAPFVMLGNWL